MTTELDQVVAGLRAGGWRSSEERLQATARKRLATARRHQQQAAALRADAQGADGPWGLRQRLLESALRHDVRGAERAGLVTRAVRNVALRLAPTWTGSTEELLSVASAVAQTCPATATGRPAIKPSARDATPDTGQAS